jgi:hypothetical protein
MRTLADAEQILRHGQAQIALRKAERLSFALGDDEPSRLQLEVDVEQLWPDVGRLGQRDSRARSWFERGTIALHNGGGRSVLVALLADCSPPIPRGSLDGARHRQLHR